MRGCKTKNFETATRELNELLRKEQPLKITSSWIVKTAPQIYYFFWRHIQSDSGDIDWDKIISHLDKEFQKKWGGRLSRTK